MDSNAYVSLRVEAWQNGTPRGVSPAHNSRKARGVSRDTPAGTFLNFNARKGGQRPPFRAS